MSDAVRAGSMPPEVRAVVSYGAVAGVLQLLGAAVLGPVLAREANVAVGVAVAVVLGCAAIASFVTAAALQRGSERARRLMAWPADRDVSFLDLGVAGWTRQRLRSKAAVQWFARTDRARRKGGPR